MRVAVIERFADPSRRCAPELVTDADDEVVVWDLVWDAAPGPPTWRDLALAVFAWMRTGASPVRIWMYLRAAWKRPRWRKTGIVRVPSWLRAARRGEIDAMACYALEGFDIARLLAEDAGVECREQLASTTQYFGEFAFEMLAVVPYAYWLHEQGRLECTVSTEDTRALYYFSPRHVEHATDRRYVAITEYPIGEMGGRSFDHGSFPRELDTSRWSPPPYREIYRDDRFSWPQPVVVVSNKSNDERYLEDGGANRIPTDTLLDLVGRLTSRYVVIYNRAREVDIVADHEPVHEIGDIEAVTQAYPEVVTIQALHEEHPDLGFNELQLRLYASCERFVSVLGGGSYLASWFGGTNIVYAREGWEVDCDAYRNWFDRFSGANVVPVATPAALLATVEELFLGSST